MAEDLEENKISIPLKKQAPTIYCISDLHVEHYETLESFMEIFEKLQIPKAEFLVLAGDICDPLKRSHDYIKLLLYFKKKYKNVILVAGNHEYYSCNYNRNKVITAMKAITETTGVVFLNRNVVVIDDVRFIGATLWSAIDKHGFDQMNDRKHVFENFIYYLCEFTKDFEYIRQELETSLDHNEPVVVVTHHLPSDTLVHKKFKGHPVNTGFGTNITDLVNLHGVKHWFCGHTHEQMEIEIGDTLFTVNPMGYPGESRMTKILTKAYEI